MSNITQVIKNKISTITGKRRLTILQKFIDTSYSKPDNALRNVPGEYSPKQIITELRQLVNYLKGLCANNGKHFKKYYSYESIDKIDSIISSLSTTIEPIQESTGQNALRTILYALPTNLEALKQTIGPFSDIKPTEVIQELTDQIASYTEKNEVFEELREKIQQDAKEINTNLQKSRKLKDDAETLVKELNNIRKDFTNHESIAKEILNRIHTINSTTNDTQKKLQNSINTLSIKEEKISEITDTIQKKSEETTYLADTIHNTSNDIEAIKSELQYLTSQARHALHISHGAGIAKSYRKLEEKSKKKLPNILLLCSAIVLFISTSFLIIQSYFTIRYLPSFSALFTNTFLLGKLIFIPLLLMLFFASISLYRKKLKTATKYSNKVAALESFLHISDRMPYDSPERVNTANYIFNIIRRDFGLEYEIDGFATQN